MLICLVALALQGTPTPESNPGSVATSAASTGPDPAIIAAVIAAIALIASTILTQWLQFMQANWSLRRQEEREVAAEHRAIKREQRERFLPASKTVLNAALEYKSVAHQKKFVFEGKRQRYAIKD